MTRFGIIFLVCAVATACAAPRPAPLTAVGTTIPVARSAPPDFHSPDLATQKALEKNFRDLLLANLPNPLVQSERGWGQMKEGVVGVKFHRDGPRLWTETLKGMRNDGVWRRVSVRAVNPAQTLTLVLSDVVTPEQGRMTFDAHVGVDCTLKFEQQLWRNGTRLYSGETRGRCRTAVLLTCEVTSRTETKPGNLFPDMVFRMRVTDAHLTYENLVIEHTAGMGGDAAKLFGEAIIDTVKRLKPDLERELQAKANAAVVKAADTKEIRVSFEAFLKGGGLIERKKK